MALFDNQGLYLVHEVDLVGGGRFWYCVKATD